MKQSYMLSKKYAKAFLDLYSQEYNEQLIDQLKMALHWAEQNSQQLFLLSLTIFSVQEKEKWVSRFVKQFSLGHSFEILLKLLLKNKHITLLDQVLYWIRQLYMRISDLQEWNITSSHTLTDKDKQSIQDFIKQSQSTRIRSHFTQNKNLIAGIRMMSDTLLWEYSIADQLKKFQLMIM